MFATEIIKNFCQGKCKDITIIRKLNICEIEELVFNIRDSSKKDELTDMCFQEIKSFAAPAFYLIYDNEKYINICRDYLEKDFSILNYVLFNDGNCLDNSDWLFVFVCENIDKVNKLLTFTITSIFESIMKRKDDNFIRKMLYTDNLELRGKVMNLLMDYNAEVFFNYYVIPECFCKRDSNGNIIETMEENDVSNVAYEVLNHNLGIDKYKVIQSFILKNYKANSLAERLDGCKVDGDYTAKVPVAFPKILIYNINQLFLTASNYKLDLYLKYEDKIDKNILRSFLESIKEINPLIKIDKELVTHIFKVGLGQKLIEYVMKYKNSIPGEDILSVGCGSCTRAFSVGQYVIKCSYRKWLSERCPDLFLIAKNYEETYIRDEYNNILGSLEVQKYYTRPFLLQNEPKWVLDRFMDEMARNGYEFIDYIYGRNNTPNLFYLNSYREADCDDPEQLPNWFKEYPLVLVDRDMVLKK